MNDCKTITEQIRNDHEAEQHREETQEWLDKANTSREAERAKLLKQWMDAASAICAKEAQDGKH